MDAATGAVGSLTTTSHANIYPTGVVGTGQITSVLVWGKVVPGQDPEWDGVNDSQSPSWGAVDDAQSPGWQEVA